MNGQHTHVSEHSTACMDGVCDRQTQPERAGLPDGDAAFMQVAASPAGCSTSAQDTPSIAHPVSLTFARQVASSTLLRSSLPTY